MARLTGKRLLRTLNESPYNEAPNYAALEKKFNAAVALLNEVEDALLAEEDRINDLSSDYSNTNRGLTRAEAWDTLGEFVSDLETSVEGALDQLRDGAADWAGLRRANAKLGGR